MAKKKQFEMKDLKHGITRAVMCRDCGPSDDPKAKFKLAEKCLLVLLGMSCNDKDWSRCYPGETYLAARMGVNKSTVSRTLANLISQGLIKRQYREGKTTLTTLMWPAIVDRHIEVDHADRLDLEKEDFVKEVDREGRWAEEAVAEAKAVKQAGSGTRGIIGRLITTTGQDDKKKLIVSAERRQELQPCVDFLIALFPGHPSLANLGFVNFLVGSLSQIVDVAKIDAWAVEDVLRDRFGRDDDLVGKMKEVQYLGQYMAKAFPGWLAEYRGRQQEDIDDALGDRGRDQPNGGRNKRY
jgi:hypothetical protein